MSLSEGCSARLVVDDVLVTVCDGVLRVEEISGPAWLAVVMLAVRGATTGFALFGIWAFWVKGVRL